MLQPERTARPRNGFRVSTSITQTCLTFSLHRTTSLHINANPHPINTTTAQNLEFQKIPVYHKQTHFESSALQISSENECRFVFGTPAIWRRNIQCIPSQIPGNFIFNLLLFGLVLSLLYISFHFLFLFLIRSKY